MLVRRLMQFPRLVIRIRPSTAPANSSDTSLVTRVSYNADSTLLETVINPLGKKTKAFYDRLGRSMYVASNWDDFIASSESGTGDTSDKSKDRVTKFTYNGLSQIVTRVAMDASADGNLSDNQTTTYLYDDPVGAERVTSRIYSDSSDTTSAGTDQVKSTYHVDGSLASRTDQRGVVLETTYDGRRQLVLIAATLLGAFHKRRGARQRGPPVQQKTPRCCRPLGSALVVPRNCANSRDS